MIRQSHTQKSNKIVEDGSKKGFTEGMRSLGEKSCWFNSSSWRDRGDNLGRFFRLHSANFGQLLLIARYAAP